MFSTNDNMISPFITRPIITVFVSQSQNPEARKIHLHDKNQRFIKKTK